MNRPVVVVTRLMRPGWCLNLFGTLWVRDPSWLDASVINHEGIHTAQQRELLYLPFYVLYGLEWVWQFLRLSLLVHPDGFPIRQNSRQPRQNVRHAAYRAISFEREAYGNAHNLAYLAHRRPFAQWRSPQ